MYKVCASALFFLPSTVFMVGFAADTVSVREGVGPAQLNITSSIAIRDVTLSVGTDNIGSATPGDGVFVCVCVCALRACACVHACVNR